MSKTVLANGCFDVLHYGHILLLKGAAEFGDLTVLLNSDVSIKKLKGSDRPIHPQDQRKAVLEAIRYVYDVIIFDTEKDLDQLIRIFKPDVLAKGPDWKGEKLTGQDTIESYGGRVEIIPISITSSTAIIERIKNENISSR